MNTDPANSSPIDESSRCAHSFSNGKRCTSPSRPDSDYCSSHAAIFDARRESEELAATLTDGLDDFTSASTINDFLSRLLLLLVQDRLPPRRAAVMAYTANLLLHTLPAIERENAPPPTIKLPPKVIWSFDSRCGNRDTTANAVQTPAPDAIVPANK